MPVIYVVFESMSVMMMAVRQNLQCLFVMDCAILMNVLQWIIYYISDNLYIVLYVSLVSTFTTFENLFLKYGTIFHAPSFINQS